MADIITSTTITPILSSDLVTDSVINTPFNDIGNMITEIQAHHNGNLRHDGDLTITGTLSAIGGATYLYTQTVQSEDNNIELNKNGSDATAANGGFTILGTSDVALAKILYDTSLTSKFKAGASGSEKEIVTVSDSQTLTSKILTSPDINGGTADALTSLTLANSADIGDYEFRAKQFISDVPTGTQPILISSTTKVNNLNADQLDDLDSTAFMLKKTSASLDASTLAASGENEFAEGNIVSTGNPIVTAMVGGSVNDNVSYKIAVRDASDNYYLISGGVGDLPVDPTTPSASGKYVAIVRNNHTSSQNVKLNFIVSET